MGPCRAACTEASPGRQSVRPRPNAAFRKQGAGTVFTLADAGSEPRAAAPTSPVAAPAARRARRFSPQPGNARRRSGRPPHRSARLLGRAKPALSPRLPSAAGLGLSRSRGRGSSLGGAVKAGRARRRLSAPSRSDSRGPSGRSAARRGGWLEGLAGARSAGLQGARLHREGPQGAGGGRRRARGQSAWRRPPAREPPLQASARARAIAA